jgi:RNA-binding protein PNO1
MPAPTALQRRPEELADDMAMDSLPGDEPTASTDLIDMNAVADDILPDTNHSSAAGADTAMVDESGRPQFAPSASIPLAFRRETRKVPIPPHRMTPLKAAWPKIYVRRHLSHLYPRKVYKTTHTDVQDSPPSSNTSTSKSA